VGQQKEERGQGCLLAYCGDLDSTARVLQRNLHDRTTTENLQVTNFTMGMEANKGRKLRREKIEGEESK
jgi:hypothetical protein